MDMALVTGALSAANAAVGLLRNAVAARDEKLIGDAEAQVKERFLALATQALELVAAHQTLMEEHRETKERLRTFEDFRAELEQYELCKTVRGGTCFRSKERKDPGQFFVYLCANCATKSEKTFLQESAGHTYLHCTRGHGNIPSDTPQEPDPPTEPHGPHGWMG